MLRVPRGKLATLLALLLLASACSGPFQIPFPPKQAARPAQAAPVDSVSLLPPTPEPPPEQPTQAATDVQQKPAGPASSPQPLPPARIGNQEYPELLSNSLFLFSPSLAMFDVQAFLASQPGPLKSYTEEFGGTEWTAAQIISFNAISYGLNPQFLLTLLEAEGGLISRPDAQVPLRNQQYNWHSFMLYMRWLGHKSVGSYDAVRFDEFDYEATFDDGTVLELPKGLNAGTAAVQAALARVTPPGIWAQWVMGSDALFAQRFRTWFGDPLAEPDTTDPAATLPPGFMLPFASGENWYFTGGPHSYDDSGARPWSSLDIAPPEKIWCPGGPTPTDYWITAAAGGVVLQSSEALVVIDHGNGWRTYYSHISPVDRIAKGATVARGQQIGHASCSVEPGGYTDGIHVHFAVWHAGQGFINIAGSTLSGYTVEETSHYNGTLTSFGSVSTAESDRVPGWNDILNHGPEIKVLQVYPDGHDSRVLARGIYAWSTLFEIETVPITAFNSCTVTECIVDAQDPMTGAGFKRPIGYYDVLVFGIADQFGGFDVSRQAAEMVRAFAGEGKGLVFTHDTIAGWEAPGEAVNHAGFCSLADITGIVCQAPTKWHAHGMIEEATLVAGDLSDSLLQSPYQLPPSLPTLPTHWYGQTASRGTTYYAGKDGNQNEFYLHTYRNPELNSYATFIAYGHTVDVPQEWEAKALINAMYQAHRDLFTVSPPPSTSTPAPSPSPTSGQ